MNQTTRREGAKFYLYSMLARTRRQKQRVRKMLMKRKARLREKGLA